MRDARTVAEDYVRGLLLDGVLRGGDRIRCEAVAAELGMSCHPVRHAMIGLGFQGWVRTRPFGGFYATAKIPELVADAFELLGIFYGHAARTMHSAGRSPGASPDGMPLLSDRTGWLQRAILDLGASAPTRRMILGTAVLSDAELEQLVPVRSAAEVAHMAAAIDGLERRDGGRTALAVEALLSELGHQAARALRSRHAATSQGRQLLRQRLLISG